ncbi:HET domain-containing protein [Microdochium nivale]|nr:HET domain-containing protein [Microdochium nivale]
MPAHRLVPASKPSANYAQLQKRAVQDADLGLLKLLVAQAGPAIDMSSFGHLAFDIMRSWSPAMGDTLVYLITSYGLSPDAMFPGYPGADYNVNLLQRACEEGNCEAVEMLLQHGAGPDCPGLDKTALEYLIKCPNANMLSTSKFASRSMPIIRSLMQAEASRKLQSISFLDQKYSHPAEPPARASPIPLQTDYAWPRQNSHTVSMASSQALWVEETNNCFTHPNLPTGHTRFVELLPSSDAADPIQCNLFSSTLDQAPDYELLSIASESSAATLPITIQGHSFEVSLAVWDALHRVRLADSPRRLWLDALCVNAKSAAEHAWHARQRETIYRRAGQALVWLGATEHDSELVFAHLDKSRREARLNWPEYQKGTTEVAFKLLCQRSWFYKIDSALVFAFSRRTIILCGVDLECPFEDLVRCTSFQTVHHPTYGIHGPSHVNHLRCLADTPNARQAMLYARLCDDTNPEDRITGIATLICGIDKHLRGAASFEKGDVPSAFLRDVIASKNDIWFLHQAGAGSLRLDGAPSWVPSFAHQRYLSPLPRVYGSGTYSEHFPWKLLAKPVFTEDGAMVLKGVFCGTAQHVGAAFEHSSPGMIDGNRIRKVMRSWESLCTSHLSGRKRFPQPVADAFADTIVAFDDHEQVGDSRPTINDRACDFIQWYKHYGAGILSSKEAPYFDHVATVRAWQCQMRGDDASDEDVSQAAWTMYPENVQRAIFGRRFFVTDDGSMGLAPANASAGDRLVYFPGGLYPWVVRPRAGSETYELIGDCYLYDFKVVEIFRNLDKSGVHEIIIL